MKVKHWAHIPRLSSSNRCVISGVNCHVAYMNRVVLVAVQAGLSTPALKFNAS